MLTKQIAQYIAAQGLATLGTNLFYDDLPSNPNIAISVFSTGGFESSNFMGYDDPTFQVRTRHTTLSGAYNATTAIYNVLQGLKHTNLISGGIRVISIAALQSAPENIGKDEQGRYEFTQNYRIEIRNDTTHRD